MGCLRAFKAAVAAHTKLSRADRAARSQPAANSKHLESQAKVVLCKQTQSKGAIKRVQGLVLLRWREHFYAIQA
jgi:hypothetical protein